MKSARLLIQSVIIVSLLSCATGTVLAERYVIREVMSGLVSPRGLAIGPDGGLYVAEGGSGGKGPTFIRGDGVEVFLGASGAISRSLGGVQERVLDGLPSLAREDGTDGGGLNDILFDGAGQAYGLFGLGGSAAVRDSDLGDLGSVLGTIARLPLGGGALQPVADIAAHELAANPAGMAIDSNPFQFTQTTAGGFLVADAGGNDFLHATGAGDVTTLAVLPPRTNPLPFGPPMFQAVPTSIAVGPDDAYYVGQLTGFPFPPGAANVYRFDPATSDVPVAYTGFTNIVDLTFDDDGNLYVLQITTNGLASAMGPGPGALNKIDATTGDRTTIASEGLLFPGSVLAAPDGTLYVTNQVTIAGAGQVLSLTLVPEPSSLLLVGLGLVAALAIRLSSDRGR